MSKPLVSVIISTYKRTNFLKIAIESVINQTFQDFEIIVVDDGTPNEDNLLLCNRYNKVKYIKIDNSGSPTKPRNIGIRESVGEFITFLDDDDIWEPNKIEILFNILNENPKFGLAHHYCSLIDENGLTLKGFVGRPGKIEDKHGDISMKMIGNYTVSDYPLCRSEIIKRIGFFNENMKAAGEDVEYWNRASFFTKFYYVDLPLTRYRVHSANNSVINLRYYLKLNIFNKKFLHDFMIKGIITESSYKKLIQSLIRNQIKMCKQGLIVNFYYLFKLNKFWFLSFYNIKLMVFVLFFKK